MFRAITVFLLLVLTATSMYAEVSPVKERPYANKFQKSSPSINKLTAKTGVVYKAQTAVGYVTTIELPDEALKVFAGDQDLFVVEVYGREVIVKPATDYTDARSNLTIYTQKSRLSFDVSVGLPETADFVLDFRYPGDEVMVDNAFKKKLDEKIGELEADYKVRLGKENERVRALTQDKFEEAFKKGLKTRRLKISKRKDDIELNLLSLSEIGDRNYLKFSVTNNSKTDFPISLIVLAKETFKRSGFGVTREGFTPVEFTENIQRTVPKESSQYGVVSFGKVLLNKDERLVLRLYEKDKTDPIEISPVPLEV